MKENNMDNWGNMPRHEEPEKTKDMREMPDGSLMDMAGKSEAEIRDEYDAYRDNK